MPLSSVSFTSRIPIKKAAAPDAAEKQDASKKKKSIAKEAIKWGLIGLAVVNCGLLLVSRKDADAQKEIQKTGPKLISIMSEGSSISGVTFDKGVVKTAAGKPFNGNLKYSMTSNDFVTLFVKDGLVVQSERTNSVGNNVFVKYYTRTTAENGTKKLRIDTVFPSGRKRIYQSNSRTTDKGVEIMTGVIEKKDGKNVQKIAMNTSGSKTILLDATNEETPRVLTMNNQTGEKVDVRRQEPFEYVEVKRGGKSIFMIDPNTVKPTNNQVNA